MKLVRHQKRGWLIPLLEHTIAAHPATKPASASEIELPGASNRGRARAYLRRRLRQSGLLFGTPADAGDSRDASASPGEALLHAVIRTFAEIGLEIADLLRAPPAQRRDQLLKLLTATFQVPDASGVEATMLDRAKSLARDPVYGLVLHNASVYVDAQLFGRFAINFFSRGELRSSAVGRLATFAAGEKAVVLEILAALVSVDRPPTFLGRWSILQQIKALRLQSPHKTDLRRNLRRALKSPPSLQALVQPVRSADLRRFILEQTILASLVKGQGSTKGEGLVEQLASALRFGPDELARIEVEMAEFYAANVSLLDVFRVAAGAGQMTEEMVSSIQQTLEKNFHRLMQEVRETGELSVQLSRAARGQTLTAEEWRRVRAQLIDVAKVVPALAIFAAPGGILLLIALAKVLPFNILPSAFQDQRPKRSARAGGAKAETVDSP